MNLCGDPPAYTTSIRYSCDFRCRYIGRSPFSEQSMYLYLLCRAWASHSAFCCPASVLFRSSGQLLSTVLLIRCINFRTSPTPLIQCSNSILYQNLFRLSENLVMKVVLTFSHVAAFVMLFSYHSAAGSWSTENSGFSWKCSLQLRQRLQVHHREQNWFFAQSIG